MSDGEVFAPHPTGTVLENLTLTGMLIPWRTTGGPVLLSMPACDDFFLALFSTEGKLREVLGRAGVKFDRIKHIDDGVEFIRSLPTSYEDARLRVIVDPWFTEQGRVRFIEVQR